MNLKFLTSISSFYRRRMFPVPNKQRFLNVLGAANVTGPLGLVNRLVWPFCFRQIFSVRSSALFSTLMVASWAYYLFLVHRPFDVSQKAEIMVPLLVSLMVSEPRECGYRRQFPRRLELPTRWFLFRIPANQRPARGAEKKAIWRRVAKKRAVTTASVPVMALFRFCPTLCFFFLFTLFCELRTFILLFAYGLCK